MGGGDGAGAGVLGGKGGGVSGDGSGSDGDGAGGGIGVLHVPHSLRQRVSYHELESQRLGLPSILPAQYASP